MVTGYAVIDIGGRKLMYSLTPLELARVACHARGFDVVDAEPSGSGGWLIKAHRNYDSEGKALSINVTGASLTKACERLIDRIS